jgi:hypothetical protein
MKRGRRIIGRLNQDDVVAYEVTTDAATHIGYLYSRPSGQWVARGLGELHDPEVTASTQEEAIELLQQQLRAAGALS